MSERSEALWRILVGIIVGIIYSIWTNIAQLVAIVHWFYVLIAGKRSKDLAEFNNHWATYSYKFFRYSGFSTNVRPWPFTELGKPMKAVDMKKPKK